MASSVETAQKEVQNHLYPTHHYFSPLSFPYGLFTRIRSESNQKCHVLPNLHQPLKKDQVNSPVKLLPTLFFKNSSWSTLNCKSLFCDHNPPAIVNEVLATFEGRDEEKFPRCKIRQKRKPLLLDLKYMFGPAASLMLSLMMKISEGRYLPPPLAVSNYQFNAEMHSTYLNAD